MHFHFPFTTLDILWTLTFAAHLVLLVVLLGRDRAGRFPFFTASIVLVAFRLLTSRMLLNRLPQMTMYELVIVTADISVVVGILLVLELARRAFSRVSRPTWIASALALMALGAAVLKFWGVWEEAKTVLSGPPLQLLRLLAQNGSLLVDVETIAVGLLIVVFGYRYGAGWRSHTQQIAIGLSTASIAELGVNALWVSIVRAARANPAIMGSITEQTRVATLGQRLSNANSALYVAVLIWWIVCLWIDEPWARKPEAVTDASGDAAQESPAEEEAGPESDHGAEPATGELIE